MLIFEFLAFVFEKILNSFEEFSGMPPVDQRVMCLDAKGHQGPVIGSEVFFPDDSRT